MESPPRHGCLSAFLLLMLAGNSLAVAAYLLAGQKWLAAYPLAPAWAAYLFAAVGAINVGLTIALYYWKRAAFYAFWGVAIVVFGLNVSIGIPAVQALTGFVGPVFLTFVLQIGGNRKGWYQLR